MAVKRQQRSAKFKFKVALDATIAPALIRELPAEVRYVLGDRHYADEQNQVQDAAEIGLVDQGSQ